MERIMCEFCTKFTKPDSEGKQWYDVELFSTHDLAVVPGLGAMVEGYLLLVVREHIPSFADLGERRLLDMFQLKAQVRKVLTTMYSPPIFFEHGPSSLVARGGTCIDHAHIHALPLSLSIADAVKRQAPLIDVHDYLDIPNLRREGTSYLYFEDQSGRMFWAYVDDVPSQFFRKLVCEALGRPDEWDYAVFPGYHLIRNTIGQLTPWPDDS